MQTKKIFILAGEFSGDQYAATLVSALRQLRQDLEIYAMGGEQTYKAGAKIILDPTNLAVVGIWEVLRHLKEFKYMFKTIEEHILTIKPDVIIFIDYPGFNLRLAKKLRPLLKKTKFVYYIPPQLWAWGRHRINLIKKIINEVFVIFPFEVEFYKKYGIQVKFVGHPLGEILEKEQNKTRLASEKYNLNTQQKKLIACLPGSRIQEVKMHLPIFLSAIKKLDGSFCFCINKVQTVPDYIYKECLDKEGLQLPLIEREEHNVSLKAAKLVWVASGTATLETAFYHKPMIVVYKISNLSYLMLRPFVKIKYISMVNILANKLIVPELIQNELTPENLVQKTTSLLKEQNYQYTKDQLKKISNLLFSKGVSLTVAKEVLNLL